MVTQPRRYRLSVRQYHQMAKAGVFGEDERLELIDGEIIQMTPIGPEHAYCVTELHRQLVLLLQGRAWVQSQGPVQLGDDGEPIPDLMLLRPPADRYRRRLPKAEDVLLIVEVADTTLAHDRGKKARLYARHGIPEYWVVDIQSTPTAVVVYRDPGPRGYRTVQVVRRGEPLVPQAFPDAAIDTRQLLELGS